MAKQDETTQQAPAYVRHQGFKSLDYLRVLVERTAADCGRCLASISEEQAPFKPGDEWSVKEVLDHLIYATAQVIMAGRGSPFRPGQSATAPTRDGIG
jgi:hypothetical protein